MILAITNRHLCHGDFIEQIQALCQKPLDGIILREKDLSPCDYTALAKKCKKICEAYQMPLYINHFTDAALQLKCSNLQLSFSDFCVRSKQHRTAFERIAVSVHSPEEAIEAQALGADLLIAGHIYATDCKRGLPPRGLEYLSKVVHAVTIPVYAIGGIHPDNIQKTLTSGCQGVCMMSEMMKAPLEF